jgi:hypothetical protein
MMMSLARCSALLMLPVLVAGCGISISGVTAAPPEMSTAQLRASGKGVLIVSARFATATMLTPCQMLQFAHAGDGRQISVVVSGYSPFTVEQPGDGVLVTPGTYIATKAYCQRGDTTYVVQAPDPLGIAKISIAAGEVVDAGTLIVTDDFKAVLTPYLGKSNFWAFARPRIEPLPAGLSRELATRVVRRTMTTVDPPPYELLAQICSNQREHAKSLWFGGNGDPPLCQLIGPRPVPAPAAGKQRPGQAI